MRVLHYVPRFSQANQPYIYDQIIDLQRAGIDDEVATLERVLEAERPFPRVHVVPVPRGIRPDRALAVLRERLDELIDRRGIELVHAHFGQSGVLLHPVTRRKRVPLVVGFHGFDASALVDRDYYRSGYRAMGRDPSVCLTAVSESLRTRLVSAGVDSRAITVVRAGKRADEIARQPAAASVQRWLSVGRLIGKKGHGDLIAAFARLPEDQRLTIIGGGPLRSQLEDQLGRLGVQHRVSLAGELAHHDVLAALASADAFVLASRTAEDGDSEGVPTALMEAMLAGLPVVATAHAGIPELLPAELLIPEGNPRALADKMCELYGWSRQRREAMGAQLRARVLADFALERQTDALLGIYERLARCPTGVA